MTSLAANVLEFSALQVIDASVAQCLTEHIPSYVPKIFTVE